MPSQEEYLENLLKQMESEDIPEQKDEILNDKVDDILVEDVIDDKVDEVLAENVIDDKVDEVLAENVINDKVDETLVESVINDNEVVHGEPQSQMLTDALSLDELLEEETPADEISIDELSDDGDQSGDVLNDDFMDESLSIEELLKNDIPFEDIQSGDGIDLDNDSLKNDDFDIMELLSASEDEDLLEIQNLLQKDKNHELIIEDKADTLSNDFMEVNIDQEEKKSLSKKEQRAALKEAKKTAKEEKKQERKAKKKKSRRESKQKEEISLIKEEKNQIQEDLSADLEIDTQILDSIVSEAMKEEKSEPIHDVLDTISEVADLTGLDSEVADLTGLDSEDADISDIDSMDVDVLDGMLSQSSIDDILNGNDSDISVPEMDFPDFQELDSEEAFTLIDEESNETESKKSAGNHKKGFFGRLIEMLTEEEEEEESQKNNENIILSDENKKILEELDSENKKDKKSKKGKEKKNKKESADDAEGKIEKKPKKVKKRKEKKEPAQDDNDKKLSMKKVFPVILVGASVFIFVFVFILSSTTFTAKKRAKKAFYQADYATCYQNLYGRELDESEQIMFSKSESILCIRLWLREYEMYEEQGEKVKALDSLIQTVSKYPELYAYAAQYNAADDISEVYAKIIDLLKQNYHLTEEEAKKISEIRSDYDYTVEVTKIANGYSYIEEGSVEEVPSKPEETEEKMLDILPEEENLEEGIFIEN